MKRARQYIPWLFAALGLAGALAQAGCGGGGGSTPAVLPTTVPAGMHIYVGNGPSLDVIANATPSVVVFPIAASGNVAPSRTISGSATQMTTSAYPVGAKVDPNGRLWLAMSAGPYLSPPLLLGFGSSATGNVAPSNAITIQAGDTTALARNAAGTLFTVADEAIAEYSPATSGTANPIATIGPFQPPVPDELGMDGAGALYTLNQSGTVNVYAPGAAGNASPIRSFVAPIDGSEPYALAVDPSGNVYISTDSAIDVYPAGAVGSPSPRRAIQGTNTTLASILAMAVDPSGYVYVTNVSSTGSSIVVFAPNANGNARPVQIISGPNTGLDLPTAIAIGP